VTEQKVKGGRYTLLRPLGAGSQGETFEARDEGRPAEQRPDDLAGAWNKYVTHARDAEKPSPKKPDPRPDVAHVAIKRFRVDRAKTWKDVELAEREIRTLASLDHPRLPKYIEHFEEDGALYLVMEKIEGESLATLRSKRRSLDAAEVQRMLEDIADALRYLHGRAPFIVHRDIKPGNIIRRPDGSYALVDFGAVRDRLKREGGSTVVGTFGYMAPEQFQGRASPKSDVYGLGATALTMLTGCEPEDLPHEGLGIDVARSLPKSTGAPLVRALTAMLAPDPDRRAASVDEALAFLRVKPAASEPPREAPLSRKEARALRRRQKREARDERHRRRDLARGRRAPFLPRALAKLGLLIAWVVVWLTVGLVVPLVLGLLSLFFGKSLRRAAAACFRAATRTQAALGRASSWLSGFRAEDATAAEPARVRIVTDLDRVRAVTEREAQAIAIANAEARGEDAEAWMNEQLEEAEREQLAEEQVRRAKRRT
jgi:hypothetical protein